MNTIYRDLYFLLFNYISLAIEALERKDHDGAKEILMQAQIGRRSC